ncbi:hypothetical protein NBRC10512_004314 [Rhodotorula toruloides]|uniref:RHTO0S12e01552g2_1 n=2 Tax=Rhodotorula toruloides TaxID=5286 RepID=A0A061B8F7_RHOTO|nr:uncharacterized protein RHTO_07613 [Rhodotorula toruloides NP11]EMS23271.1 hypothetical protein RHTO_07613 [Rhodotorula toruloides NP11]CDR46204.1 RHTO0S12e01552g2_1 [Rhodotorula toruloides]
MSTSGAPGGNRRATQPPLDGPSLATPHRSPFPTSLRPSLFHARPTPLSATYSPVSSVATPVTLAAAAHLQAPHNTPSSAFSSRTTSAPAKNPFERLPASSFDSFVSSVTRRIKSALEPGELPSERRRREREEREREREKARREREEARRRKQEEDVFGEIRALGEEMRVEDAAAGDLPEEQFNSTDFADRSPNHEGAAVSDLSPRPHSPSSVVYGHMPSDISLPSTSVSTAPSVAPQDEDEDVLVLSSSAESSTRSTPQPEMREVRLGSSHSLFVARATASVSSDDDRGGAAHDTGRDESFGLETGPEDDEEERPAPFDRFDEPMADERRDARDEDAPLVLQEDEFDVDAIGEGVEAEEKADVEEDELDIGEEDDITGEDEELARAEARASQSLEREDAEIAEDTPYYRDPFDRPILYAQPTAGENDDEGDVLDYVEDVPAPLDENPRARLESPVDLAADKGQVGEEAIESEGNEGEDYGLGEDVCEADGVFGTREEEEEEEASRSPSPHRPSVTETIELGSSSDEETAHATRQPRPATQDADDRFAEVPQLATYGAEVVESREPFAFKADIDVADYSVDSVRAGGRVEESQAEALEAVHVSGRLSPRLTPDRLPAAINDQDAFSADTTITDAQEDRFEKDRFEEEQVEMVEQQIVEADEGREFFGENTPGDEVEQGGEISEDDEEMENVQVPGRHNPLEALYADEDSEDLGPSIPYEIKGKGRAPPQALEATDSGDEISDDDSDSSIATITSENVDFAIADWMKWAPRIKEYDDDQLAEKIFTLSAQLELAMDVESPRQHLIAQQLSDFHSELARRMPPDDEDEVLEPSRHVDSADDAALVADDEQDGEVSTTSPDRSAFQQDSASPEPIDANAASQAAAQLDAIASNLVDLFDRGEPSLVQVPQDALAASEEPRIDAAKAVDGLVEPDRASSPAAGADNHRALSPGIDEHEGMETSAEARERATPAVKLAEDSSIQLGEAASVILAPPETAMISTSAASSSGALQRSAPFRTLQHPAFSSHFGEESGPQPDFASRVRYEMPPTIHRVNSPARSDSAGPDLPQDGSIRIGVTDEEMLDASLVGRHVPLWQAEAATSAAVRQQEDGGFHSTSGGLLVIDDDAEAGQTPSPPRPQTPVPAVTASKPAGATPPPADQLDDVPTIIDGVAPPQNFDIVPAPLPRSPSPVAHTTSAAHRHVASSLKAAADEESPAPPADAPMSTPASLAKTDSAEDLDHTHLQSEIGPQPAFDSRVRYEAPPAIHSVDSPVHDDDGDSEAREDGAVRVGLSDEELQDAMLAGSAPRLATTDNLLEHDVQEQRDTDVEAERASAGLVVIDDDAAEDEQTQQPLSDLHPADRVEPSEDKGHELGASPPPSASVDAQPPVVDGTAPPQNPALLPSTVPRETGLGDFVAFGDTDEDEHDADELSAADEAGPSLEAPKSPGDTASHVLGLPAGEETVVVSNSAETSDDSDEEGVIAVRAAPRSFDLGAQAANRSVAEQAVESAAEVDIAQQEQVDIFQQEPTLQPEYARPDAEQSVAGKIAVKNVVEPGEWNRHDPIEFGTASAGEFASVDVDVALEDEQVLRSNEVLDDAPIEVVDGSAAFANGSSPPPAFIEPDEAVLPRHAEQDDGNLDEGESTDEEQLVISLVGSSGRNGASREASLGKEDAGGGSASSSTVTAAHQSPSLPGKIPQRLRLSTPLRRSSRLSLPPSPAASTPTQPTSTIRRSRTAEEASSTSTNLPSPAKRQRVTDPPKSQDAPSSASSRSTGARLHQHRHRPTSAATPGANGVSPPLTRSRCHFSRLRISSREDPSAPPYLFNVPTCALASDYAQETMRRFHVENLGDVPDSDDCEGIQLGGQTPSDANAAEVMESRHSALVPHEDVLDAVRRIAGSELWDEGACEVLPREEVEGRVLRGGKRASTGASSAAAEAGKRRKT